LSAKTGQFPEGRLALLYLVEGSGALMELVNDAAVAFVSLSIPSVRRQDVRV